MGQTWGGGVPSLFPLSALLAGALYKPASLFVLGAREGTASQGRHAQGSRRIMPCFDCHPAPACLTAPTQIGQCKQQQVGKQQADSTHLRGKGGGPLAHFDRELSASVQSSMLPSIDGFPPPPPPPPLPSSAPPQAPSTCLDPDTRPRLDGLTLLTLLFRHRRQRFRSDQGPHYDHVGPGLGGLRALLLLLFLLLPKQAEMGIDLRILAPLAETYHLTGPAFRPLDTTGKQGPDPGPGEVVLRSKSSPPAGGGL
ncbi:predicted protein [Verticillium alfalfae VaMs.102]|uniref:Predicted protein n=1 Tax=Verticillium alfalfae (strain VaMs.102 / ATCC MYA-4576 / FGSC 10136) TaxID=526221 RepID=C9STF8_VERA1|nr:predicted protein [Verticillium alfalfae VaMs.102]EEY22073.1 predicted protein [Verticillium alfalfae VaMs.102]